MKNILLSIVVPTKNRYQYLMHLIELISSFRDEEIELIIQDNSENNNEIIHFLNKKQYSNLQYYHISESLSQSGNSDLAILNSNGKYVCFIGDDDGVTKYIVDCVRWMEINNIDALISSPCFYNWPSCAITKQVPNSVISLESYYSGKIEYLDCLKELNHLLSKGMTTLGNLPRVYQGIVKRSVLNKIYDIGGTFFPGPSPDMANAVSLAFLVDNFVKFDFPIVICGQSSFSGGGNGFLKGNYGKIEDQTHLPKDTSKKWEEFIPKVWCSETIWPESAAKALRYMGKEELINRINNHYLLANFAAVHPDLFNKAAVLSSNRAKLYSLFLKKIIILIIHKIAKIILRKILHKDSLKRELISQVSNIEEANSIIITKMPNFVIID